MESLIMKAVSVNGYPIETARGMMGSFFIIGGDAFAFSYTVNYYKEFMARPAEVKHISIDGVYANKKTIENKTYPFTANVFAVIREYVNHSSTSFGFYIWLRSVLGQHVVRGSGDISITDN